MKVAKVKQPRTNNHKSTQVKVKHKVTPKHKPTAKPVSFTATTSHHHHQPTIRHISHQATTATNVRGVVDDEHTPTGACSMVYGDCINTDEQLGSELKTKLNTNNNYHHGTTMMNDNTQHHHSTGHKQPQPPKQCPENKTTSTASSSPKTKGIPTSFYTTPSRREFSTKTPVTAQVPLVKKAPKPPKTNSLFDITTSLSPLSTNHRLFSTMFGNTTTVGSSVRAHTVNTNANNERSRTTDDGNPSMTNNTMSSRNQHSRMNIANTSSSPRALWDANNANKYANMDNIKPTGSMNFTRINPSSGAANLHSGQRRRFSTSTLLQREEERLALKLALNKMKLNKRNFASSTAFAENKLQNKIVKNNKDERYIKSLQHAILQATNNLDENGNPRTTKHTGLPQDAEDIKQVKLRAEARLAKRRAHNPNAYNPNLNTSKDYQVYRDLLANEIKDILKSDAAAVSSKY